MTTSRFAGSTMLAAVFAELSASVPDGVDSCDGDAYRSFCCEGFPGTVVVDAGVGIGFTMTTDRGGPRPLPSCAIAAAVAADAVTRKVTIAFFIPALPRT